MTRNYYTTGSYNPDYSTFGGTINFSDFCTDHHRSEKSKSWAERIVSDWKFDEQCKKNMKNRNRNKNYKNYKKGVK